MSDRGAEFYAGWIDNVMRGKVGAEAELTAARSLTCRILTLLGRLL